MPSDDDDELDESALPSFSGPSMGGDIADVGVKGKARAPEQLAPPSGTSSAAGLSGNIGSISGGAAAKGSRRTVGGVQVETR